MKPKVPVVPDVTHTTLAVLCIGVPIAASFWILRPFLMPILLLVFTVLALTVDNVLRPVLIKKGADLPLILIFAGVIGGLVAFGVVGLFVGPVVLAIASTALRSWVASGVAEGEAGLSSE